MLEGICGKNYNRKLLDAGIPHDAAANLFYLESSKMSANCSTTYKKAISPINSIASSHQNLSLCDGQRLSFQSIRHRKYHPTQHVTNLTKKAYPSRILCPPASQTFFPIYPCKHTLMCKFTELVRHCHTALT